MNNNIDETIDYLMRLYSEMISDGRLQWHSARKGLEIVASDLSAAEPNHPAIVRLRSFMADMDRQAGNGAGGDGVAS